RQRRADGARPGAAIRREPEDPEENRRADRRRDDGGNDAGAEMDAEPRQQPITDECADNADEEVGNEAKAGTAHEMAGEPSGDEADDENDKETFARHGNTPRSAGTRQRLARAPAGVAFITRRMAAQLWPAIHHLHKSSCEGDGCAGQARG